MATKKTLMNVMTENSLLTIECRTKEELTKVLYKVFRVGRILYKWDNKFLDETIKELGNIEGAKRTFLIMRNRGGGNRVLEIYCDPEEDTKNSEGEILEYSKLLRKLSNKFGIRKTYEPKAIEKLIDGIRIEESSFISQGRTIGTSPAEKIPELDKLMENVEEGRIAGRRREEAHAQREADRARQREHDARIGRIRETMCASPRREEEQPREIPSVAIINTSEGNIEQGEIRYEDPYESIMFRARNFGGGGGGA